MGRKDRREALAQRALEDLRGWVCASAWCSRPQPAAAATQPGQLLEGA